MNFAYDWAFANPIRKVYDNITIVGIFVLTWSAALAIWHFGKIEQKWTPARPSRPPPTAPTA